MAVQAGLSHERSSFPVLLVVGLVCGVVIVILMVLCCCRKSKDSGCLRLVQSERGSSTNHTVSHTKTHEYSFALHDTSNLYDSLRPSEDPVNDAAEAQHVTYSLLVFKNSENKTRHHEPEEGAVYSEVKAGAARTISSDSNH
ncbi:hypothetical protein CHARACLAT_012599 [Characodon lateralis]|uniref:Uncharacterized protein n=1 Tax=Characodon lateralis TaxID=208331 RepID=A0ABU7CN12_9TELE|nr:hypothetical protein [Characodon lateralis]